jgi:hypothetical protein
MIVMPANASGWFWHCLARETGKLGHLYSPGAERGPWPWFPFAIDNGAFSAWDARQNVWDPKKWDEKKWMKLLFWAQTQNQAARWAIVPDVPGNAAATFQRWQKYAGIVEQTRIPLAMAVQDGMEPAHVRALSPAPQVICVGGTTDWKWATVGTWTDAFERVHVLRCNSPEKLGLLEQLGVESCDGTGWNRGDRTQTLGLETWARADAQPITSFLTPHVCRAEKNCQQLTF